MALPSGVLWHLHRMQYRTVPKFSFRDWRGVEWRIRRAQTLRSSILRWRVEQRDGARWEVRAVAPTRNLARARMAWLWSRAEAAAGADGVLRSPVVGSV